MLYTLADLYTKLMENRWQGRIACYPSEKLFNLDSVKTHTEYLDKAFSSYAQPLQFGEPVLVLDEVSPKTLASMFYLWAKGAVLVPVRHTMSQAAKLAIAKDCGARFCLNKGDLVLVNQGPETETETETKNSQGPRFTCQSERRITGVDLALIIYTSGSTGKPKGIMLSHTNVLNAMMSIGDYLALSADEHILCLSPLSFDYGLYQVLFSLAYDCELTLFEEEFHPIKVLKCLEQNEISLLPVVPAMASALTKLIKAFKKPLPHLMKLTNTGGHLAEDNIRTLKQLLPQLQIFAMYGLTECKRALYLPAEASLRKLGSVGIPVPGLEAKIFKQNNHLEGVTQVLYEEVEQGEVGELFIRGTSLMQGYFGTGNAGAAVINGDYRDDNWLATGDLFSQDEEGYFYFKGRSKDLIKQAGFCLYPAELEAQIEQHANVFLCAIVPHKDKWGDEIACLNVQLIDASESNQTQFQVWLSELLDTHYRPKQVIFIDEIALTQNAKVDKQRLIADLSIS